MEYIEVSQESFEKSLPEDFDSNSLEDNASKRKVARKKRRAVKRKTKAPKKAAKKAKRKARRKKIAGKIKNAGERVLLAPLVPLKPVMVKALKNKNKPASVKTPINTLARDFYNFIVVKHSAGNFEPIDFDSDIDYVAPAIVSSMVSAIVTFIKSVKKKKASGEKLSKTEEVIATGTEKVEMEIEEKAKEEAAQEVGGRLLFDKKTQMYVLAAIAGLILVVWVIKKN